MARTKQQALMRLKTLGCEAFTKCNGRCKNPKKYGKFCGIHRTKEECPICYENKKCDSLVCGHKLCKECSESWLSTKNTCPMCRAVVREPTELEELTLFSQAYMQSINSIEYEDILNRLEERLFDYFGMN